MLELDKVSHIAILALLVVVIAEIVVVVYRLRKKETFFSSMLLFGKYRMYRSQPNKIMLPATTVVSSAPTHASAPVYTKHSTPTVAHVMTPKTESSTTPRMSQQLLVPKPTDTTALEQSTNVRAFEQVRNAEPSLDAHSVNRKLINILNIECSIASDSGNVNGVYAMNILIKDIVDTHPHHIWNLGAVKAEFDRVPLEERTTYAQLMKFGYIETVNSHLASATRMRNRDAEAVLTRVRDKIANTTAEELLDGSVIGE